MTCDDLSVDGDVAAHSVRGIYAANSLGSVYRTTCPEIANRGSKIARSICVKRATVEIDSDSSDLLLIFIPALPISGVMRGRYIRHHRDVRTFFREFHGILSARFGSSFIDRPLDVARARRSRALKSIGDARRVG